MYEFLSQTSVPHNKLHRILTEVIAIETVSKTLEISVIQANTRMPSYHMFYSIAKINVQQITLLVALCVHSAQTSI